MALQPIAPGRRLVSISEAAKYVGVNPMTIRRMISAGSIPGFRFGPRLLKVDLSDVDAQLRPIPAANTTSATDHVA
jgi:excisionase family DNA binding protein